MVLKNGVVTLEGQVEWQYQKQTAEKAVRRIKRNQERHQCDPAQTEGRAGSSQDQDCRCIEAEC